MKATWTNTRSVCKSYGLDIATFDTLDEFNYVSDMCKRNKDRLTNWVHVGGATTTPGTPHNWFWVTTGEKIAYDMPWNAGNPNSVNQVCLSIGDANYRYDDIDCHSRHEEKFICQTAYQKCNGCVTRSVIDNSIKTMF